MKPLKRLERSLCHVVGGDQIHGANSDMSGDCSGLRGDCTELSGDCSGLRGYCSGLSGDLDAIPRDARPCNINNWVEEGK